MIPNNSSAIQKDSRLVKLNSQDVYEISGQGVIKVAQSSEDILLNPDTKSNSRPRSGRFKEKRPWSNRSYRRHASGSVVSTHSIPSKPNKKIFSMAKSSSLNSRKQKLKTKFNFHLSKVDKIIGQTEIYKNEICHKKMPRTYNKL